MRTCPNCQFFVVDGETTCSVCHRDVPPPPPPVPAGAGPWQPGAPGPAGPGPLPGAGGAGGVATAVRPTAPPRSGGGGRVALVVGLSLGAVVLVVGVLLVGAVMFLGTTASGDVAAPDRWQEFRDDEGRIAAELPGRPVVTRRAEPMGDLELRVVAADVANRRWNASVVLFDVPDGISVDVPPEVLRDQLVGDLDVQPGLADVVATGSVDVETELGPAQDTTLELRQGGQDAVGLLRVVRVGDDRVVVLTIGPAGSAGQVDAMQRRVADGLRMPAA